MEAVDVRGRFVWHELMTRDVPGAKAFYSKLMSWDAKPWAADPNYTVCLSGADPEAGIMAITAEFPAEMPAHWVNYIGTRDVDGTAAAAVRAGGSIVREPEDIEGAGRYAVLKDPQGAVFAILDPENSRPDYEIMPPIGQFSWHELATSDHEAAFAFYSNLFGWEALQRMDMGPLGTYLIFGWKGNQRGGIYNKPADMPAPPNWLPYARVPNADAAFKTAMGGGAREVNGPMDVPGGGRIAAFFDPTGAAFAVVSSTQDAADASTAKPKSAAKAKPKPKAKPKSKSKPKPKSKVAAPTKKKAAKKPAAKGKVARKAARKAAKKSAPKKKSAAKRKVATRRKK
jgi:predicted enzyme related to lactoylglutathione lyase